MATWPEFTPAPWKLETESRSPDGSDLLVTTADGAWNIADCRDHNGLAVDGVEQAEANARLIAAAPRMYEALKACLDSFELAHAHKKLVTAADGGIVCACDLARAALRKADGHAA